MKRLLTTVFIALGFCGFLALCANSQSDAAFYASKLIGFALIGAAWLGLKRMNLKPLQ